MQQSVHHSSQSQQNSHNQQKDINEIKGAVNATFRAISSPQALAGIGVGDIQMSELARRRRRGAEKLHSNI